MHGVVHRNHGELTHTAAFVAKYHVHYLHCLQASHKTATDALRTETADLRVALRRAEAAEAAAIERAERAEKAAASADKAAAGRAQQVHRLPCTALKQDAADCCRRLLWCRVTMSSQRIAMLTPIFGVVLALPATLLLKDDDAVGVDTHLHSWPCIIACTASILAES